MYSDLDTKPNPNLKFGDHSDTSRKSHFRYTVISSAVKVLKHPSLVYIRIYHNYCFCNESI